MAMWGRLRSLWNNLAHRARVERDLDDEVRTTFDLLVDEHMRQGMSRDRARRAATLRLGQVDSVKAQVMDVKAGAFFSTLLQDLRYGARLLGRSPLFAATAGLSLAIGIGANTSIFTLVNVLMLRDLEVAKPHELVEVGRITPYGPGASFSYPIYERLRDHNDAFTATIAMSRSIVRADASAAGRPLTGRYVSGNFFDALGVSPTVGRLISTTDDRIDAGTSVAVISHGLWMRSFGGSAAVLGTTINVDDVALAIVGVLPATFGGLLVGRPVDFYIPLASEPRLRQTSWLDKGDYNWLSIVGRLKPGASIETAAANLGLAFASFIDDYSATMKDPTEREKFRSHRLVLTSARAGLSDLRRQFSKPVLLLMGAVGLVMLIACANVVNLLLARGIARTRELALRVALGASRARLLRQLLTESILLGVISGGLGFLLAAWGTPLLVTLLAPGGQPLEPDVSPDGRVLLFTIVLALASSVVAGALPALRSTGTDLTPAFRGDPHRTTAGPAALRWNRVLIVAQVALSLVLLTGASLLATTLRNLRGFDPGFDRERVLLLSVYPPKAGYTGARLRHYYREVLDRLRATPGVATAAVSVITPISGGGIDLPMIVEGRPLDSRAMVYVNMVSDGYFDTLKTQMLLGRDFVPSDEGRVAIVNDVLARRYFGEEQPIGKRIALGDRNTLEIVGMVSAAKYLSLREQDVPTVYLYALADGDPGGLELLVGTSGEPRALAPAVRREAMAVAPGVTVSEARTLADQVDRSLVVERLVARLLGTFAIVALVLAAVGLYGVLGYSVVRQTAEIGVRLALGASRASVLWSVVRGSWLLVAVGSSIGLAVAVFVTPSVPNLSTLLYGVRSTDLPILAGTVTSLFLVASIAAALPAWRASRVDPLVALRHE
jgi:putative ABC transport system permease protein